jgi:hypothetical protein
MFAPSVQRGALISPEVAGSQEGAILENWF